MTDADRIMHDAFSAAMVESLAPEGAPPSAMTPNRTKSKRQIPTTPRKSTPP